MKKSVWMALGLMVTVIGVLIYRSTIQTETVEVDSELSREVPSIQENPTSKPNPVVAAVANADVEEEFNPYESEVFKAQIQQVADAYEQRARFPDGSQPVFDLEAVREPEPFEFTEVDLPFPDEEGQENPIRVSAATDTYQYFQGDVISARVQISGAPADTFAAIEGVMSGAKGDLPLPILFEPTNEFLNEFTAQIDTKVAPQQLMTTEMLLKLNVTVGDKKLFTTVVFRYNTPSAEIVGVMPAQPQGPNLVIPLQVSVGQDGYYFVRGVLDDAQSAQPLIELQSEARLQTGNGVVNLNAHISALRLKGSEGPYRLRSLKLYRGAEAGEMFDHPGSSLQKSFDVAGFPFSAYQDEEYEDEYSQERLAFLRQLGSVEAEQDQANTTQETSEATTSE